MVKATPGTIDGKTTPDHTIKMGLGRINSDVVVTADTDFLCVLDTRMEPTAKMLDVI